MSTPPLNRDQQLELMTTAAERHAAQTTRWMENAQVQTMLRTSVTEAEAKDMYEQHAVRMAKCA